MIDGVCDGIYDTATVLDVDRVSCAEKAIPGDISAKARVTYTADALYVFVEVTDGTRQSSDMVYVLVDEKRYATENSEIFNVEAYRNGARITDGNGEAIEGAEACVKVTSTGYNVEIKMPWRYKTSIEAYDSFGFDCFVYNNRDSSEYKSLVTWSDYNAGYKIEKAGELYFRKEN